ncbi:MAG: type II toxin-antitoxin system RelE/ParE family toxin [Chloroflexota bacterium]|nr:type II toxin-antitoxin system RelE/ParE family toxin [Chloroflexota bacterium]
MGVHKLIYAPRAQEDVREHVAYLRRKGETVRLRRFDEALATLEVGLLAFPRSGRALTQGPRRSVRRIGLRYLPLFVWYVYEPERDEITIVRLFHVKQSTPPPPAP